MSLLTPERVPVKVYKWDDVGAPQLDSTVGCVATIIKACLVTGYGTQASAGWTMPFEDTAAGVKVLRPEVSPHTDFYLRLSADTGTKMAAQVYLNMTDANTGDLKLQCGTPFVYADGLTTTWILIATGRSFWFFCNQTNREVTGIAGKAGSYLFAGDLLGDDTLGRPVYLKHTGGTLPKGYLSSIFGVYNSSSIPNATGSDRYLTGRILLSDGTVNVADIISMGDGFTVKTLDDHIADCIVLSNSRLFTVPGMYSPLGGAKHQNFDTFELITSNGVHNAVNFGTGASSATNTYITTDEWVY